MATSDQSTYLQYLPAIFQRRPASEPESVPFLGQFLRPFEEVIGSFEDVLAVVDRSFSPAFARAEDFLPWLASWIALVWEEEWSEDRRRRLLAEAMQLYQWRGTVAGLKRYLEIYTELEPEAIDIRECRQPAGMQIGVSSRIGVVRRNASGPSSVPLGKVRIEDRDYYLVDTLAPAVESPNPVSTTAAAPGDRVRFVYPADWVQRIALEEDGVRLWYGVPSPDNGSALVREVFHTHPDGTIPPAKRKPNITRRNGLIDFVVARAVPGSSETETLRGGAFLIEETEAAYRFIVILKALGLQYHADPGAVEKLAAIAKKVHAVLDAEKPAHTLCYLKITPMARESRRRFMQVGVRSSIGADTLLS
jgi:phage tail-like protein